jgi:hypothetical protein
MTTLTADLQKRLRRVPSELAAEFPDVPADRIRRDVDEQTERLLESARVTEYIPILVHKELRARLRAAAP